MEVDLLIRNDGFLGILWSSGSVRKVFLEIFENSQENTCARVSFLITSNFIKEETLTQVCSCEFCKISENTFFYRTPLDDCFLMVLLK